MSSSPGGGNSSCSVVNRSVVLPLVCFSCDRALFVFVRACVCACVIVLFFGGLVLDVWCWSLTRVLSIHGTRFGGGGRRRQQLSCAPPAWALPSLGGAVNKVVIAGTTSVHTHLDVPYLAAGLYSFHAIRFKFRGALDPNPHAERSPVLFDLYTSSIPTPLTLALLLRTHGHDAIMLTTVPIAMFSERGPDKPPPTATGNDNGQPWQFASPRWTANIHRSFNTATCELDFNCRLSFPAVLSLAIICTGWCRRHLCITDKPRGCVWP